MLFIDSLGVVGALKHRVSRTDGQGDHGLAQGTAPVGLVTRQG